MNRKNLMALLPPYRNVSTLVNADQNVSDIVNEVLYSHSLFKKDYDRLAESFNTGDTYDTCRKLFNFCKSNMNYRVESESDQTTRSPAAIITIGESDCKHYAGFIGGVLDALDRAGEKINWCYRFASYDNEDDDPQHVFVVVKDSQGEIWCDPVLNKFDTRTPSPVFYYDYKPKNFEMPLHRISGAYPQSYYSEGLNGVAETNTEETLYIPPGAGLVWMDGEWWMQPPATKSIGDILSSLFNVGATSDTAAVSVITNPTPSNIVSTGISILSSITSLFSGSSPTAAQKVFSMFPLPAGAGAAQIQQVLSALEAHFTPEFSPPLGTSPVPTSGDTDQWAPAYQDILRQYTNALNFAQAGLPVPKIVIPATGQPPFTTLPPGVSAYGQQSTGTNPLVPATTTASLIPGISSNLLMYAGIALVAYLLLKKK